MESQKKTYNKNWYLKNKSRIIEKQSTPNDCECGGKYQQVNRKQHEKTRKHKKWVIIQLIKEL